MEVTEYIGRDEFPFEAYIQRESHALSRELFRKAGTLGHTRRSSGPSSSRVYRSPVDSIRLVPDEWHPQGYSKERISLVNSRSTQNREERKGERERAKAGASGRWKGGGLVVGGGGGGGDGVVRGGDRCRRLGPRRQRRPRSCEAPSRKYCGNVPRRVRRAVFFSKRENGR